MQRSNYNGNTHGSLFEADGQWYITYHRQTSDNQRRRQACMDPVDLQIVDGDVVIKQAERTANSLVDAGTPHHYWLARTFILLSDIYVKQGKTSEAREYLQSLKNNYPGKERDILEAVDQRLANLKKKK